MIYKDFTDYLMCKYVEIEHPLDDDIPDGFEDWLVEQDIDFIIKLADYYGRFKEIEGRKTMIEEISEGINLDDEIGGENNGR